MRKLSSAVLLVAILATMLAGCVTSSQPVSPYQRALTGYVELSITYDALLDVVVAARAQNLLSDEQWSTVMQVQTKIAELAPKARALLNVWRVTGEKPGDYDAILMALLIEIGKLQGVTP